MLAELKVISCCPTRYQRDPRATIKAVDRRAVTLPNEYRQHARKIDREYGGVPDGVVGPVEAKLISFPHCYDGSLWYGARPLKMSTFWSKTSPPLESSTSSSWTEGGGGTRGARRRRWPSTLGK